MRHKPLVAGLLIFLGCLALPWSGNAVDLLIQDFSGGVCTPNNLGGPASDGGTMAALGCGTGVLASTWNATADYWYTQLTPGTSGYNLSAYDYISFDIRGSTTELRMAIRLTRGSGATVLKTLNSWSAENLPFGNAAQIKVPISDFFTVTQSTAVREIRFMTFYPATGEWLELDNIYARKETELKVMGVDIKNSNTIRVDFNAPVDATGGTALNYSLSPAVTVNSAVRRDNNRVVELTLSSALALNTTYTLTVTGVAGVNGAAFGSNNTGTFIGFSQAAVFMDNFNRDGQAILSGDRPQAVWAQNDLSNGNWFAISTATKLYGSGSLYTKDASLAGYYAGLLYDASPLAMNDVYYRFYFYAPQQFFTSVANGYDQKIATIDDAAYASPNIAFHLVKIAGAPMGYLSLNDTAFSGNIPILPDRWNSLEMHISTPANPSSVKVWLNGNRVVNMSYNFSAGTGWQHSYIGLERWNDLDPPSTIQRGMYFDEVVLSSLTYIGQIEKPGMVYASATAPDTVKVYFDRAVSLNETQWQNPATYSLDPPLTINSAVIEDDFRAISLNTSPQANPAVYSLSVNSSYLADGSAASANFLGLNPAHYLVDDFNRPNNSTLPADSPKGVWDEVWDDSVNSVTISTSLAFLTKASLRAADVDASNNMALVMKNVNISSHAYVRAYVYLDGNFFTAMSNGQSRAILEMDSSNQLCNSGNSQPCGIVVYVNKTAGGEQRLGLEFNDTADLWPGDYSTYISTGVWNSIEILVPSTGTTAAAELYLNGSLRAQVTGNVSDAGYWSRLYLGLGSASAPAFQQTAYYDEVAVSTTGYIYSYPLAYAWNGSADTSWLNAANWTVPAGPAHPAPPGPEDIAVIDTNAANQPVLNSSVSIYGLYIATTGVYGSTLTVNSPLTVSSMVVVGAKGVITHTANTTAEVYKTTITAGAMQIDGLINVTGKGYAKGRGSGTRNNAQLGAGYGGQGGIYEPDDTPGAAYGSYSAPVNLGSGGGDTSNGGSGGGAVMLNVSNALTVSGSILADGGGGSYGGGSGGSIYITAGSLSGGGALRAQGGYTSTYASGAGGRIAVIASTSGFTGGITAYAASDGGASGGAGTVFIKTPGTNGTLIIDNNNIATGRHAQIAAGDYTATFDEVRLNKLGNLWLAYPSTVTLNAFTGDGTTAYLRVDGNINFAGAYTLSGYGLLLSSMTAFTGLTDLTVGGALGAVITHELNTTAEVHKASFSVVNLTIATNGSINVSGRGYAMGRGPGTKSSPYSGAGYGGQGGIYEPDDTPGAPYGSYSAPENIGSGGGSTTNGYPGGGAVIINVAEALTVSGSILADGSGGMYGSGSGGSIYITAGSLSGGGTMRAQGGYASTYASGAGGRIAVIASTSGFTGGITAYAASDGNESGGAGTVFIKTPGTNGTLIIDNNNIATARYTGILAGDNTLDSVYSVKKSSGAFLSFSTLTIKGENAFFDGDNTSTITVSGNVYGGSFPEVWVSSFSVKWGAAGNPTNAQFTAEVSSHANYSLIEQSSATYNRLAWYTGVLNPNTTYYARAKAAGYTTLKLLTTDYVVVGGTVTLSAVPGTPANPFTGVYYTSVTLNWLANGNPYYTEFRVQASTASDFSGTLYGPAAGPASWLVATSTTVVSLPGGDTETACGFKMYDGVSVIPFACSGAGSLFYFRVQSRNLNSVESGFEVLGSTTTLVIDSRLKMHKAGVNYNILLVDPGDANASKLRIQTPEGIKAVKKMP